MKMFKKLMAVVLTGALAVSMLTGCAITDAMAESAMKSELNRLGKTNEVETTYEKGTKANDADKDADKFDLADALKKAKAAVKTSATGEGASIDDVLNTEFNIDGAVAYVYEVPSSSSSASNWTKIAKELNESLNEEAYAKVSTSGKKQTIVINYATVSHKVKNDKNNNVTKSFVIIVAKAADEAE